MHNAIRLFCTSVFWPTLLSRVIGTESFTLRVEAATAWSLTLLSKQYIHRARWIPVNFYWQYEIKQLYFADVVCEVDKNTISVQQVESQPFSDQVLRNSDGNLSQFSCTYSRTDLTLMKNNWSDDKEMLKPFRCRCRVQHCWFRGASSSAARKGTRQAI
jgi:hypothetical protein